MSWPSNYGRLWGQIPNTAGQVFWVAPSDSYTVNGRSYAASDDHGGLAPDRALRTVNRAWQMSTENSGDVIVLLPGAHTVASSIAANKAGVTMTGLPGGAGNSLRTRTSLSNSASDEVVNVTASDIEIAHIKLIPNTAVGCLDFTSGASGLYIHDCVLDMATPAVSVITFGFVATGSGEKRNVLFERIFVECDGAQGQAMLLSLCVDSAIRDCVFTCSAGTWASVIACGAGADRLMIERCRFYSSGTAITVGINGTGANQADGVKIVDCRFDTDVTTPIDNFDAGEANIAENYDMGVGGGDGGGLITAIT